MNNLNDNFRGKYDLGKDLFCYVDESGDEGFKFDKNCTKWFTVSGIVLTQNESNEMINTMENFVNKYCQKKSIGKISFKELSHNQRKNILGMLSRHKYLTVHSSFYKPDIDPTDRICTYPSMYFVGIKNIIERVSWIAAQYKRGRVHILISNRNSVDCESLKEYLFSTSFKASKNLTYKQNIGMVCLSNPTNHNKLILSDYAASSMAQALEKTGEANVAETIYFDIFLRKKMYASTHTSYGGVWNNGFKCTPGDKKLVEHSGILEEGSHKF